MPVRNGEDSLRRAPRLPLDPSTPSPTPSRRVRSAVPKPWRAVVLATLLFFWPALPRTERLATVAQAADAAVAQFLPAAPIPPAAPITPIAPITAVAPAAAWLPVEPSHPVYDDLEHFRALGLWSGSLESRPLTRAQIARAARQVDVALRGAPQAGGAGDRARWRRLDRCVRAWGLAGDPRHVDEIREPVSSAAGSFPQSRVEISGGLRVVGVAARPDSLFDLDRRARRDYVPWLAIDAAAGHHLFGRFRFFEDYSRLTPHRPGDTWSDNLPPSLRMTFTEPSARNDRAIAGFGWPWGSVRLGREDRRWGVGRHGTLFLSENPFPLDGVSFQFETRWLAGASLVAQLRRGGKNLDPAAGDAAGDDSLAALRPDGDGWLAAHRYEFRPPGPLRIALWEAVAWGGRGIDPGYVNPIGFLLAITQDIHDRARIDDKKVIGFDLTADLRPVSLHGEFLINRLVALDVAEAGEDAEISGFAQLAGLRWANPFGWSGADVDLEAAHLDPEVYFHHDSDPTRQLLAEGELIGHWLGPNADLIRIAVAAPPLPGGGLLRGWWEQARWGLLDGRRGSEAGFVSLRRREKGWITGPKEIERTHAVEWSQAGLVARSGLGLDAALAVAWVDRTGRRAGDGWQAEIRVDLRGELLLNDRGGE